MAVAYPFLPCTPKRLSSAVETQAAAFAVALNPANDIDYEQLFELPESEEPLGVARIAALTNKKWETAPRVFSVYVDGASQALADKIVAYANKWRDRGCNKSYAVSNDPSADVRISLGRGGYWSYLGTDCAQIALSQPTMNLERFSLATPDSEFDRVVCHEFGHQLGFPHEHLRAEIVARIHPAAAMAYFARSNGWSRRTTRSNVLTPIDERQLIRVAGMETPDEQSIMCYQLPGEITYDGRPIRGGDRINDLDAAYAATIYPLPTPPDPDPDRVGRWDISCVNQATGQVITAIGTERAA